MKIEKLEIKTYKEQYVAEDGTVFMDKNECEQYESSALAVLKTRLRNMATFTGCEFDIFNCGSEECESYVVIPKSKEDIDLIRQLFALRRKSSEYIANFKDDNVGKVVVITMSTYDDWIWWTSLNDIVENITDGKFGVYNKEALKLFTKQSLSN